MGARSCARGLYLLLLSILMQIGAYYCVATVSLLTSTITDSCACGHRGRTAPVAAPCTAAAAAAAAFLLQLFRATPAAAAASAAAAAAAVAAAPASACAPGASRRNQPCLSHHVPALPPLSAGGASVLSYSQGGGRLAGYSSSATWCQPSANYLIDFTLGCYSCAGSDTTWPWCVDRQSTARIVALFERAHYARRLLPPPRLPAFARAAAYRNLPCRSTARPTAT